MEQPPLQTLHKAVSPSIFSVPISSGVHTTVVIEEWPVRFGPNTQSLVCPHCRLQVLTRVKAETNNKTHIYAGILCMLGCWLCAWLPYSMSSCQNKSHYCPNCGAYLATYVN